jgi:hypothetical protein
MRAMRRTAAALVASAVALAGLTWGSGAAHAAGKPAWKVTLQTGRTSLTLGQKVRMDGHVSRGSAGLLVMLQERGAVGQPWKNQRQARVHADGTFTTYDVPSSNTRRSYRVLMPGTRHRHRGISPVVTVGVYQWTQLTSFPPVNQSFLDPTASVSMNGTDYPASLEATTFHPKGPTTQSVEFNLDRLCTQFRGTFGLSDDSMANSQASVTASADGTPWFNQTFSVGGSMPNDVTFSTPPLKVSFNTASLVTDLDGFGAVGTPEVFCTR